MKIADCHNDLLMLVARRPRQVWGSYFRDRWIPQLLAGGIDLQVLPVFIDSEFLPEKALRETFRMIEAAHVIAEENADHVILCTTGSQIKQARSSGRIALVLALEGCPQIGTNLELLTTVQRLGVRMISFTHFGRTMLADGSGEDGTSGGLTRAGFEAVQILEELGVLVDISHLGRRGVEDVLTVAHRPVVASHSSAFALRKHHRNLTDDQICSIGDSGGLVCVNLFAGFLSEQEPLIADAVAHVEHVVGLIGEDKVGLGGDFVAEVFAEKIPACDRPLVIEGIDTAVMISGLEGPAGYPLLIDALSEKLPETAVEKIAGQNLVQLLERMI